MDAITGVRNFLEGHWQNVVDVFGGDDRLMFGLGCSLALLIPFVLVNVFCAVLDFSGKPAFLVKFRMQKDRNFPMDKGRYLRCLLVALMNEATMCALLVICYPLMKFCGMSALNPLPSAFRAVLTVYFLGYADEFFTYYGHRLLHWGPLYKKFHKLHHEWNMPISVSASYLHPVDCFLTKFLPFFAGPMLCGAHLSITLLSVFRLQASTLFNHSGYHFPGLSSPQFHDYHHSRFNECFGGGLLDKFHGTDVAFQQTVYGRRNKVFYSFSPITEQYPDDEKKK